MAKNTDRPRSVLISRFSALGDVAMTIPVVYSVCAANPGCDFYYLTRPLPASLMPEAPPNLHVLRRHGSLQRRRGHEAPRQ